MSDRKSSSTVCWSLTVLLLVLFLGLTGCEEQEKKAEERGKIPQQTLENAQKQVDDAAAKMNERLGQLNTPPADE